MGNLFFKRTIQCKYCLLNFNNNFEKNISILHKNCPIEPVSFNNLYQYLSKLNNNIYDEIITVQLPINFKQFLVPFNGDFKKIKFEQKEDENCDKFIIFINKHKNNFKFNIKVECKYCKKIFFNNNIKINNIEIKMMNIKKKLLNFFCECFDNTYNSDICVCCLNNNSNVILYPCKHFILCTECFLKWKTIKNICPYCRKDIKYNKFI